MVDTSVLFPHRLGLPYKRSLRNLMADYLRQIIQDNGEGSQGWGCGDIQEVRTVLTMSALQWMGTAPVRMPAPACTLSSGRSEKMPRPSDDPPTCHH